MLNIKKFQDPAGPIDPIKQTAAKSDFWKKLLKGFTPTGTNIDGSKISTTGAITSAANTVFGGISSLLPTLDNKSTASSVIDVASDIAPYFGTYGQVASVALKGVNLLDQALGKTAKTQATAGETATGYNMQFNPNSGTRYGGLFGTKARKRANRLTSQYDISNILKLGTSRAAQQEGLASQNAEQSIQNKNYWQLQGNLNPRIISAEKGAYIKALAKKFKDGGKMNVIPEGAFHSRKNNLDIDVTDHGIPVISIEEGGELTQHAEVERNEITFSLEVSKKIEEYTKKYNDAADKEKSQYAIELGKILTSEILDNTDDRTGLINTVE